LRLCPTLDRAGIHPHFLHPIQIERDAGIGQERAPVQRCDCIRAVRVTRRYVVLRIAREGWMKIA
jgi:hypothetical protein